MEFSDSISSGVEQAKDFFVGREKLISRISAFLSNPGEQMLLVTGEPGIGKTALAKELARRIPASAIHYCSSRRGSSIEPLSFIQAVSSQLIAALKGFDSCLVRQINPNIHISIQQTVGNSRYSNMTALNIENIVMQSGSAYQAFEQLIKSPLQMWCRQYADSRVVLIIDAIDEACRLNLSPNIMELVCASEDLPSQVKVILTSRVTDDLDAFHGDKIVIRSSDEANISDLRRYIGALSVPYENSISESLLQNIARKADGNFLYASYIMTQVSNNIIAGKSPNIDDLPIGLQSFYRESLQKLNRGIGKEMWRNSYRPVLGLLSIAFDSLPFSDVSRLTERDAQSIHDVLSDLTEFLDPDDKTRGFYKFFHASFADFIGDKNSSGAFWIDLKPVHRSISKLIMQEAASGWVNCSTYGLRYIVDHLAVGEPEDVRSVLLDYAWLLESVTRSGPARTLFAYSYLRDVPEIRTIEAALRLSAHVLSREPERLPEQLVGRLEGLGNEVEKFIRAVRKKHNLPWLRPLNRTFSTVGGMEYRTLVSESIPFTSLCFGKTETCLISGSEDGTVSVWDLEIGQSQYIFRASLSPVTCVNSYNDALVLVGYADGIVAAWNLLKGVEICRYSASSQQISQVSLNTEELIICVDSSGFVFTSPLGAMAKPSQKILSEFSKNRYADIVLSSDGSTVACLDRALSVWDVATGQRIYRSEEATDGLWNLAVALSSNGKVAITTYHDGLVIHKVDGPALDGRFGKKYISHYFLGKICIGRSGNRLYWIGNRGSDPGGNIGRARLEAYEIPSLKPILDTQGSPQSASALAISNSDKFLAYSYGNRIRILDLSSKEKEEDFYNVAINRIFISPNGALALCTVNRDGALIYNIGSTAQLGAVCPDGTMYYRGPGGGTYAAAFSSNGRHIVVGSYSGVLCLLDTQRDVVEKGLKRDSVGQRLAMHKERASFITFLGSDKAFAAGDCDGQIFIWDIKDIKPRRKENPAGRIINAHDKPITKLLGLPGSHNILSSSLDGFICVSDWKTGDILGKYENPSGAINDFALLDASRVCLMSSDLVIRILDLTTRACIDQLTIPKREDGFVSPDKPWNWWATRIAATTEKDVMFTTADNQVGFLQRSIRKPIMSNRHHGTIRDLSVSSDGKCAVTSSSDGLVCLWDIRNAMEVASFRADSDVRACAITPNGDKVICGEITGRVHSLQLEM